jgi:hypothetical protein
MLRKPSFHFHRGNRRVTPVSERGSTFLCGLFLLLCGLVASHRAFGQTAGTAPPIVLRAEPVPFTPKEFYVAGVTDARADRKAVAYLFMPGAGPNAPAAVRPVDLQGGALPAVREYLRKNLPRNAKLRPVLMRLQEYRVTESAGTGGNVNGEVAVAVSFHLKRRVDTLDLVSYRGGIRYTRSPNQTATVEQALRQSLNGAVQYLDNWMNRQVDHNEKLARSVRVTFSDYTRNDKADTVFYNPERPLVWDDFRDTPRPGPYAATVFPSFAQEGRTTVENGVIHLDLLLKVYVLKNASWVRPGSRDEYGLNHEQRHFDLVKLVAERFKRKVLADTLTVEDYDGQIGYEYLESYREMNRLQEQYDGETQHGLNREAQDRWNRRIDEELKAFRVKGE